MTMAVSVERSRTCCRRSSRSTVRLRDHGSLVGPPTFRAEDRPAHGNLGIKRLGSGQSAAVPPRLGKFDTRLTPIPIPPKVRRKGVDAILGVVGVMYVLIERDGSSETGADIAHRDFNGSLRKVQRGSDDSQVVEAAVDLDEERLRAFESNLKRRLIGPMFRLKARSRI